MATFTFMCLVNDILVWREPLNCGARDARDFKDFQSLTYSYYVVTGFKSNRST